MKTRTKVKAGAIMSNNHNETQVRDSKQAAGLQVQTRVKAGAIVLGNHNETLVSK